jgi:hypothetical protein
MDVVNQTEKQDSHNWNRWIYALLIFLAAANFLFKHDMESIRACLLIALAFDPFDVQVMWSERPFYQKLWLFLHLALLILVF